MSTNARRCARRQEDPAYAERERARSRALFARRRQADPEKETERARTANALYRERHPERARASVRASFAKMDPEVRRARGRVASALCRERHPEVRRAQGRASTAKHNARKKGATVENVDPAVVLKRDGGICGICREPITGEWHLDHVVPLARGGEHSYKNTQAAHPFCNLSKGARLPEGVSL